MEQDHLDEIFKANPNIDRTALDRSRKVAKQLADAGIKLGGYRLMPALSGVIVEHSDGLAGQGTNNTKQKLSDQGS